MSKYEQELLNKFKTIGDIKLRTPEVDKDIKKVLDGSRLR